MDWNWEIENGTLKLRDPRGIIRALDEAGILGGYMRVYASHCGCHAELPMDGIVELMRQHGWKIERSEEEQ